MAPGLVALAAIAHRIPAVAFTAYLADQRLGVGLMPSVGGCCGVGGAGLKVGEASPSPSLPAPLAALAATSFALLVADEVSALQAATQRRRLERGRGSAERFFLGAGSGPGSRPGGSSGGGGWGFDGAGAVVLHPSLAVGLFGDLEPGRLQRVDPMCLICMDDMVADDLVAWPACCHCFHAGCLHRWYEESPMCPLRCDLPRRVLGG